MEIDEKILSLDPDKLQTDEETKALIRTLLNLLEHALKEITELREENQRLKDEIRRLKGSPRRPSILPNTSGDSRKDEGRDADESPGKAWAKQSKQPQIKVDRTETVVVDKVELPKDAVFKGHRTVIVQELKLSTDNIKFFLERYYSPSKNKTFEGELPKWVDGGFGPNLKAFITTMYWRGRVPEEKIRDILAGIGIMISGGEISNIITRDKQKEFTKEKNAIFNAGMESTNYIHTDDTGARHEGVNHHVMVVCASLFGVFFVNRYKNRDTVREVFGLKSGELLKKILLSDNARQFWMVADIQALCWVHERRHYRNLQPWLKCNREKLEKFKTRMRGFWYLLKDYKSNPTKAVQEHISTEFDKLFTATTEYDDLDERIKATFAEKDKLLVVLNHPEIPLDNNEAERDVREPVVKRRISHGTRSEDGRVAYENMMTILTTCRKNGISFYRYIVDIFSGAYAMPRLADVIRQNAIAVATTY